MILGFKDRFLPHVKDGTKTHTIRAGARWRAGMRVDIFENVRQPKTYKYECGNDDCDYENTSNWSWKECPVCGSAISAVQTGGMKLLFRAPVVKVESVVIAMAWQPLGPLVVKIDNDVHLTEDEMQAFFFRDGFRLPEKHYGKPAIQAKHFWAKQLKSGPFVGQIIHWDYDKRTA